MPGLSETSPVIPLWRRAPSMSTFPFAPSAMIVGLETCPCERLPISRSSLAATLSNSRAKANGGRTLVEDGKNPDLTAITGCGETRHGYNARSFFQSAPSFDLAISVQVKCRGTSKGEFSARAGLHD